MPQLEPYTQYLGDGVYATFDYNTVTLDLRGQDSTTKIVLEPEVMEVLVAAYKHQHSRLNTPERTQN